MGFLALAVALAAGLFSVLPHPGMFLGMGLGILSAGLGVIGWRRRGARASGRLCAAGAIAVAVLALLVSGLRYAATLMAIERLEGFL